MTTEEAARAIARERVLNALAGKGVTIGINALNYPYIDEDKVPALVETYFNAKREQLIIEAVRREKTASSP